MLPEQTASTDDLEIPDEFICPLTLELMRDPVMSRYGNSYERSAILKWVALGNCHCPLTRQPLHLSDIVTNHYLRGKIRHFQKANDMDVTIIMTPDYNQVVGYFFLPEKDLDETERSDEDNEDNIVVEVRPQQPDSRGSRIRRTVRNRTGFRSNMRQESSSSGRQQEGEPRRLMGLFQPRNSAGATTA
jgi:hypothetical protein